MTNVQNDSRQMLTAVSPWRTVCNCVDRTATGPMRAERAGRSSLMKATFAALLMLLTTHGQLFAQGMTYPSTGYSGSAGGQMVDSNRDGIGFSFRGGHSAGDTVGRNQSASFIGLSPFVNIANDGLLFGDVRLTYGNEGNLAWSYGGGYRQYINSWDAVIGGYGYFDRDRLTGADFRQWSIGAEILAHRWEARGNWYQPYRGRSEEVGSRVDPNSVTFVGQNLQFTPINTFSEALEGFDTEIGWLLPGEFAERIDLRGFGGGYWYRGEGIPGFSGFSTRLQADIGEWLELGLKLTDDEVFHTNVSFTATVHFGGFESQEHTTRSAIQRLAEPVRRNLNIATSVADVRGATQLANNTSGVPFVIAHVDSAAPAGGTGGVTDPFSSLQAGLASPADIVFTHAGSVFNAAPDNSVTLGANQSLFGEGRIVYPSGERNVTNTITLQGIGDLTLPDSPKFAVDQTLTRPTLTGSASDAVVMNTNSLFGGFVIDSPVGNGILIDTVGGTTIRDTEINSAGESGILVRDTVAGTSTTIIDTIINSPAGTAPAFFVQRGAGDIGYTGTSVSLDPSFANITNTGGPVVRIEDRTGGNINMQGATITDTAGDGVQIVGTVPGSPTLGNVTMDNLTITDSTGAGILVNNADTGAITFRNSIRPTTTITSATGYSVDIQNLGAGGTVTFEDLTITTPLGGGISIAGLEGNFTFAQDLTIGAPGAGAAAVPAIAVSGSAAGSFVQFARDVTIQGSNGIGLSIDNNDAGSSFAINGQLLVQNAIGNSLSITNNSGGVSFLANTGISLRGASGIVIDSSTGPVRFDGTTSVANDAAIPVNDTGVIISNSESNVLFENLDVQNALDGGGVSLTDNIAGATAEARLTFQNLDITSVGNSTAGVATALFGNNNSHILINAGLIDATNAAAVDLSTSGIDITLDTVNSIGSGDFGIRLNETNVENEKSFYVRGDTPLTGFGTGGTIVNAAVAGVSLTNGGQTRLDGMNITDNAIGVLIRNSGLPVDDGTPTFDPDDQFFAAERTEISQNDVRGIDGENLTLLDLDNVVMDDNGDLAGAGRETILMNYTEVTNDVDTERYAEYDAPFLIDIRNSQINDNSDDAITITQDIAALGAHFGMTLQGNTFQLTDTNDFDAADDSENAIEVTWNGPVFLDIESNTFNLIGADNAENMRVLDVDMDAIEDEFRMAFVGNRVENTTQPNAGGVFLDITGPSNSVINNNVMAFDGVSSTGLSMRLGSDSEMDITFNSFIFRNEGGTGVVAERIASPASFEISGNLIELSDTVNNFFPVDPPFETGIWFRTATGPYQIFGSQNNVIRMITLGDIDRLAVFTGNVNGQIIVNGAAGP